MGTKKLTPKQRQNWAGVYIQAHASRKGLNAALDLVDDAFTNDGEPALTPEERTTAKVKGGLEPLEE